MLAASVQVTIAAKVLIDELETSHFIGILCFRTQIVTPWYPNSAPCRPQLVKGFMQLYSVEQKRSQALEAHAAAFSTLSATSTGPQSIVISFAQKTLTNGVLTSKLHVIELGAQPGGLRQEHRARCGQAFTISVHMQCLNERTYQADPCLDRLWLFSRSSR